jgi:hypothetical protein
MEAQPARAGKQTVEFPSPVGATHFAARLTSEALPAILIASKTSMFASFH